MGLRLDDLVDLGLRLRAPLDGRVEGARHRRRGLELGERNRGLDLAQPGRLRGELLALAALETAVFNDVTWAAGTDLSTRSATSRRLTVPGATLVCSTVLSTPNCVASVLCVYCDWPFEPTPAA